MVVTPVCPGRSVLVMVMVVPAVGDTVVGTGEAGDCTMMVEPFGAEAPGVNVIVEDTTTACTPVGPV